MSTTANAERMKMTVAEEVRVALARRRMSGVKLAELIGRSQVYVSRRLRGEVPFDVEDLALVADALEVSVSDLVPRTPREGAKTVWYSPGERVVATAGEQRRKASTPVIPLQRQHRPGRAVSQTRPIGRVPASTVR